MACADTAAERWREKDQGIWEVRGEPQHFLYSKVMCWVALDRAITLAERLGASDRVDGLEARPRRDLADRPAGRLERRRRAPSPSTSARTTLDASNLMMPIVGFLPADDPRMLATIDAIADRLTDDRGLVYRYRTEEGVDGLAGDEGTFLLCTFWLAQALALAGQVDRADAWSSSGRSPTSTTSACSPRRSTRTPASCWATSRRRSATSAWSTPPGRSARPIQHSDV